MVIAEFLYGDCLFLSISKKADYKSQPRRNDLPKCSVFEFSVTSLYPLRLTDKQNDCLSVCE